MASVKGSRTYNLNVAAGGEQILDVGGEFFYVLEIDQTEFLIAMDSGSADFAKLRTYKRVEQGAQYKSLRIVNPNGSAMTGKLIAGFGEYGDDETNISGSVAVSNTGFDVNNLPASYPDGLTEITRHGYGQIGASVAGANLGTTATTLLAPASNTSGCIIRTAAVSADVANYARITSGTAAPTSITDATAETVADRNVNGGGYANVPLYIPAGYGIWGIASGANNYPSVVTFDLL